MHVSSAMDIIHPMIKIPATCSHNSKVRVIAEVPLYCHCYVCVHVCVHVYVCVDVIHPMINVASEVSQTNI